MNGSNAATLGPATVVVPRKRRNVELVLLIAALAIGLAGWVATSLNLNETLPPNFYVIAAIWVGLGLVCHLVVRWRIPYADPVLLPCVFLLNGYGLAMLARLDLSTRDQDAPSQLLWTVLGVIGFVTLIIVLRDYRVLDRFPNLLAIAGLLLLLAPLSPIGVEINGSRIWLQLGPLSFQPAEAAKLVLACAFASYLVEKRDLLALAGHRIAGIDLPRARDLGPIVLMFAVSMLVLLFERDLGTSLLFFGMFVMMLYVATERPSWPIIGLALFSAGAVLAAQMFTHVGVRVRAWLDPFADPDRSYQIIQAQYAIASGGLIGQGWGLGRPTLTPIVKSDFITAAIAEETGMAGLFAVIMIYAIIVTRGLRTALIARDRFGKLLIAGLSFTMALQVFTIIGGVTRLLPLTGLTTPFMSQGGSSLVCNWVMIAGMLAISHHARSPAAVVSDLEQERSQAEETTVINLPPATAQRPQLATSQTARRS